MKEEKTYKVKFTLDSFYESPRGGLVFVYRVVNEDFSLPLENFYVISFDDGSSEVVWGVDITLPGALEAAEREWNRLFASTPYVNNNPFTEAKKFFCEGECI